MRVSFNEIIYFVFGLCVIMVLIVGLIGIQRRNQLKRYIQISIGMTETEMLSIMGDGYNVSSLKNNRKKYEWRINASSSGSYGHGVSFRSYTGVRRVTIYTKNGFVEEIRPYNV